MAFQGKETEGMEKTRKERTDMARNDMACQGNARKHKEIHGKEMKVK
jgi:hypothetical protein